MDSPPSRFEFGALDNQRFTRLATVMQLVAIAIAILSAQIAFTTRAGMLADVHGAQLQSLFLKLAQVLVPVAVAVWTFRAGSHLRKIVRTTGDDIQHLMRAIGALSRLYSLQFLLLLLLIGALWSMWMSQSVFHWLSQL